MEETGQLVPRNPTSDPTLLQSSTSKNTRKINHYDCHQPSNRPIWDLKHPSFYGSRHTFHKRFLRDDLDNVSQEALTKNSLIVVHPLPRYFTEQQLFDYFAQISPIRRMRIIRSKSSGKIVPETSKAYIDFKDPESAKDIAETLNEIYINGTLVRTKLSNMSLSQQNQFFQNLKSGDYWKQIVQAEHSDDPTTKYRLDIAKQAIKSYSSKPLKHLIEKENRFYSQLNKKNTTLLHYGVKYLYEPVDTSQKLETQENKRKRKSTGNSTQLSKKKKVKN